MNIYKMLDVIRNRVANSTCSNAKIMLLPEEKLAIENILNNMSARQYLSTNGSLCWGALLSVQEFSELAEIIERPKRIRDGLTKMVGDVRQPDYTNENGL